MNILIEIQDDQGKAGFSTTVRLPEEITPQALIQIARRQYFFIMGDAEYDVLVAWTHQKPQDRFLSDGGRVVLQRKPTKGLFQSSARKWDATQNADFAGDSSTDAPPPYVSKKKKK